MIVIGGDDNYKDEDEENEQFISGWAKRKVSSQFNDEYMDGRKGFILSWNEKHREIHEEALRHFLDPSKRGTKFEYKPKRKLSPRPETASADPVQQSSHGSFSPERPSVKGATSHTPETERPSRSVKVASDPFHQSRHHSSSAAEPSHVRDSDKPEGRLPERRSVSPLQNYGNTQVEVSSSGSRGTQKQLIGEGTFHFVIVLFPFISPIQYSFMSYPARTKKPQLRHLIHMLKVGKVNGQKWNNILISKRTVSSEIKQNSNNKDLSNPTNRTGLE